MNNFDVIIIGAGAFVSATAYYLAQTKQKVLTGDLTPSLKSPKNPIFIG